MVSILDGADDHGDPAVVFLALGGMSCTGSVIDPRIILTAHHCVADANPGWVEVIEGFNPGDRDARVLAGQGDIVAFHTDGNVGDMALIESGVDLDVTPLAFSRDGNHPGEDADVESVGYGMYSEWESADGNKRRGSATVVWNDGFEIFTTPITCYGDSGGPLFDDQGVVVGVTSRGTAGTCSDGQAIFANVGNSAEWVEGFLTAPPVEPDPGGDDPGGDDPGGDDPGGDDPGGDDPGGVDPGGDDPGGDDPGGDDPGGDGPAPDPGGDDPGGPDPAGAGFGETCDEASACASRACVTLDDGGGYCTESCTDACPYGYECTSTDNGDFCLFGGGEGGGPEAGPGGGYEGGSSCAAMPRGPRERGWPLLLASLVATLALAERRRA